jgi:hypothetical protein
MSQMKEVQEAFEKYLAQFPNQASLHRVSDIFQAGYFACMARLGIQPTLEAQPDSKRKYEYRVFNPSPDDLFRAGFGPWIECDFITAQQMKREHGVNCSFRPKGL